MNFFSRNKSADTSVSSLHGHSGAPQAPPAASQEGTDAEKPMSAAKANPHFGEDVDDKIDGTGCSKEYNGLQDCLDETDKCVCRCLLVNMYIYFISILNMYLREYEYA